MKAALKARLTLLPVLLALAAFSAGAADVKAPVSPAVLPAGAMPVAPAVAAPADLGAGAIPEGLPVLPSGAEIPGLPASAIANPGAVQPLGPNAAAAAPVLPQGLAPQAPLPEAAGPKAAAVLAPEKPSAPAAPGAAAPAPSAKEALSQLSDKVVPASVSDAAAGSAGFSSAFDGRGPGSGDGAAAKGATYRVQTHDGVPHLHAYHPEDDDASFPADDQGNPLVVPDHLKPLLPSAQDKAHWTGRITLHLHSAFSDGTLEPEDLVQLAYDKGVRNLSLTEHDTTASTVRAWRKAKELGMDYHPGAELTARGGVHVGAQDVDIYNPKLVALLERVRAMRYRRAEAIVRHLNENEEIRRRGITLTIAEVVAHSRHDQGGTIELPHIARVLLDKGLIKSVDEAFDTYLKGDIAGDSGAGPDPLVEEVLEAIHAAGGKAVFNHPYTVDGKNDAEKDAKALAIIQKGMDGIEVYRPSHATSENGKRRADERVAKYLGWVDRFDLFAAPGADFHGTDTHLNTLVVWMPKNLAAQLKERLKDSNARALAAIEEKEKIPSGTLAGALGFLPPAFWTRDVSDHGSPFGHWAWLAGMGYFISVLAVVIVGAGMVDKLFNSNWAKDRPRLANLAYGLSLLALPLALYLLAVFWLHWLGGV